MPQEPREVPGQRGLPTAGRAYEEAVAAAREVLALGEGIRLSKRWFHGLEIGG